MLLLLLVAAAAVHAAPPPPKTTPATPAARARDLASRLPIARDALAQLHKAAAAIDDPPLRAAVEAQMSAPWLPPEAWVYAHPDAAQKLLQDAGLLDGPLELPKPRTGVFAAAPGGPCEDGHHGYPGGLAVHSLANLLHARGLAQTYAQVYGAQVHDEWLVAASIWHDSLKAATLPWKPDGSCGPEPKIANTPEHHVLGLASAMLRHLPPELIYVIASAHQAPALGGEKTVCSYLQAASILANGVAQPCPTFRAPLEAFVINSSDSDYPLTVTAWTAYVAAAPKGWARYEALIQDGNDVLLWTHGR